MYVRNRMQKNVATISKSNTISTAFRMMVETGYSQLPVVEDGKLMGLVTEKVLTEVSPSKATSLSVYEINYLLSKTKVSDIMITDLITTTEDELIENAAVVLRENEVGCLPVVNENNELLGILTRTNILDAFTEILGTKDHGTRVALEVKDETGTLANILSIVKEFEISVQHIGTFDMGDGNAEIIIRLNTTHVDDMLTELEKAGYKIISIIKKQ